MPVVLPGYRSLLTSDGHMVLIASWLQIGAGHWGPYPAWLVWQPSHAGLPLPQGQDTSISGPTFICFDQAILVLILACGNPCCVTVI
jgi:hypothetical protein